MQGKVSPHSMHQVIEICMFVYVCMYVCIIVCDILDSENGVEDDSYLEHRQLAQKQSTFDISPLSPTLFCIPTALFTYFYGKCIDYVPAFEIIWARLVTSAVSRVSAVNSLATFSSESFCVSKSNSICLFLPV